MIVEIPADVWNEVAEPERTHRCCAPAAGLIRYILKEAAGLLMSAKRPVIHAGGACCITPGPGRN